MRKRVDKSWRDSLPERKETEKKSLSFDKSTERVYSEGNKEKSFGEGKSVKDRGKAQTTQRG